MLPGRIGQCGDETVLLVIWIGNGFQVGRHLIDITLKKLEGLVALVVFVGGILLKSEHPAFINSPMSFLFQDI